MFNAWYQAFCGTFEEKRAVTQTVTLLWLKMLWFVSSRWLRLLKKRDVTIKKLNSINLHLNPWDSRPSIASYQFTSPNLVEVSGFRIPFLSPLLIQIVAPSYYWNFHSISLHLIKRISNRSIKRAITEKNRSDLIESQMQGNKKIVIYFHSTKRALWLVDSWSRAPDQIQIYTERDTIAQLLPAHRIQQHVLAILLFKGKSKYIRKHLMYGPSGNWSILFSVES